MRVFRGAVLVAGLLLSCSSREVTAPDAAVASATEATSSASFSLARLQRTYGAERDGLQLAIPTPVGQLRRDGEVLRADGSRVGLSLPATSDRAIPVAAASSGSRGRTACSSTASRSPTAIPCSTTPSAPVWASRLP